MSRPIPEFQFLPARARHPAQFRARGNPGYPTRSEAFDGAVLSLQSRPVALKPAPRLCREFCPPAERFLPSERPRAPARRDSDDEGFLSREAQWLWLAARARELPARASGFPDPRKWPGAQV